MGITPDTAGLFATVARLCGAVRRTTDHVVARAHAAGQLGATAETYRSSALELDRQADHAERLLFSQAATTFRAAAADNLLMADALEAIGGSTGVRCDPSTHLSHRPAQGS